MNGRDCYNICPERLLFSRPNIIDPQVGKNHRLRQFRIRSICYCNHTNIIIFAIKSSVIRLIDPLEIVHPDKFWSGKSLLYVMPVG